jgi:hypothetical protein
MGVNSSTVPQKQKAQARNVALVDTGQPRAGISLRGSSPKSHQLTPQQLIIQPNRTPGAGARRERDMAYL